MPVHLGRRVVAKKIVKRGRYTYTRHAEATQARGPQMERREESIGVYTSDIRLRHI